MTARLPNPFEQPPEAPPSVELAPGTLVGGRYRLERVLGQGGMGIVYAARHLELDQRVAVKVLPSAYVRDQESLQRFEREARTACRVRHANVVSVFDLGRLPTGEPYLVMEFLEGRDLDAAMGQGPLSPEVIRGVLSAIADALDALHAEGIVHRDVKPANVFFAHDSRGRETVKLVDFGLATQSQDDARLTQVGHVIGTAAYLPPESARGELSGPAGDIYSLAVMAFELLSGGVLPFDGLPMAILLDKVSKPAPSLAERTNRKFPPLLEAAVASGLRRRPDQRPRTARLLVDAIAEAMDGVLIASGPRAPQATSEVVRIPSPRGFDPTGVEETVPTQRTPWLALALVALLALSAGGAWWFSSSAAIVAPTPPTTPSVVEPAAEITEPLAEAEAEVVPVAEPALVVPVVPVVPVAETSTRARPAERERPAGAAVEAPERLVEAPNERPVERPIERPTERPVVAPEPPPAAETTTATERTQALIREAQSAMLHGEIPHARDLYREATLASPRNAAAWRGLGLASERLGLVPEARTAYERYLSIAPDARDAATVRERLDAL